MDVWDVTHPGSTVFSPLIRQTGSFQQEVTLTCWFSGGLSCSGISGFFLAAPDTVSLETPLPLEGAEIVATFEQVRLQREQRH